MLFIGHRGAGGLEPENTLRSIRRALDLGADGVEIDVHAVHGHLLVIHDFTLGRTTNGRGPLRNSSLGHIRALDAGLGERIPFLHEVLDLLDLLGRCALVNIELKGRGAALPTGALLHHYIQHLGWFPETFLVSSFHRPQLREFHSLYPEIPVGLLLPHPRQFRRLAAALGATSIHVPLARATPALAARVHAAGCKLAVYTVNEPHEIARMQSIGADAIFTDFPDRRSAVERI